MPAASPTPASDSQKAHHPYLRAGSAAGRLLAGQKMRGRRARGGSPPYPVSGDRLLVVFLVVVFAYAVSANLQGMRRSLERPYLFIFPAIGVVAALVAAESVRNRRDGVPFHMVALIFVAASAL